MPLTEQHIRGADSRIHQAVGHKHDGFSFPTGRFHQAAGG
jgi:hypothetical protein